MSLINYKEFISYVDKYCGNFCVCNFSCWYQFFCMSFGQLINWESLRDIVVCLQVYENKLYYLGFINSVKKFILVDVNENCDWCI